MIVCHCQKVNHRRILEVIGQGARSVEEVGRACGAGTGCGGCRPAIELLIRQATGSEPVASQEPAAPRQAPRAA